LAVEIVKEILRRLDLPDTIEVVPWARGYSMALSEPLVGLFSTTRLPQREKLFHWVGPVYTQTWGFYAKKGSGIRIRTLAEAMEIPRIGTYHKDAKEQFLRAKGFANLISANRNISNVRHLLKGDIDVWVSSDFNMPYLVRQAGEDPNDFVEAFAFRRVDNYIVFSLQTPEELVAAWQQTLAQMKRDGTYRKICARFDYFPER
jgi:polar amino acid transport system substrate-binding protein